MVWMREERIPEKMLQKKWNEYDQEEDPELETLQKWENRKWENRGSWSGQIFKNNLRMMQMN